MESGFEHRQASSRAHALAYQIAVTVTGKILVLTEKENTDKGKVMLFSV